MTCAKPDFTNLTFSRVFACHLVVLTLLELYGLIAITCLGLLIIISLVLPILRVINTLSFICR